MPVSRIALRYATPILELAEEKKVLDNVKEDMKSFTAVCEENRHFALMLKSPIIAHQKKAGILKKVFSGKVNDLTLQAFDIITRKNREHLLEDIAEEFLHLYNMKKGLAEALVTTSFKLDDEIKKSIEKLAKDITGKDPLLSENVDSDIVGGYILRIEDRQLDESVRGQLKELKLKFSKNK